MPILERVEAASAGPERGPGAAAGAGPWCSGAGRGGLHPILTAALTGRVRPRSGLKNPEPRAAIGFGGTGGRGVEMTAQCLDHLDVLRLSTCLVGYLKTMVRLP